MKTQRGHNRRLRSRFVRTAMFVLLSMSINTMLSQKSEAQWLISSGGSCNIVNLQFPSGGFVSIGATTPSSYVPTHMFEVFGTTWFGGNSIVNNGNLTLTNGNLSVTGNGSFLPNGGVASTLTLWNAAGTFSTGFKSVAGSNITYSLPANDGTAGQVLTTNGSAGLNWSSVGGGNVNTTLFGTPTYIPKWTTPTNIENSIMYENGGSQIVVGPTGGFLLGAEVLQVSGSGRIGNIFPPAGVPTPPGFVGGQGNTLNFSGVAGTFGLLGGAPTNGENTDPIFMNRSNNANDVSELRVSVGDNPEGLPGPAPNLGNGVDQLTVGATNGGVYYQLFSMENSGRFSIGYNVAHANALDVGYATIPGTAIPASRANVAIGTAYAGTAAPLNGLMVQGFAGFGSNAPGNQVEINSGAGASATSGLRLSQFAGAVPLTTPLVNPVMLSVNTAGDVILCTAGGGGGVTGTGASPRLAVWNGASSLTSSILYEDNANNRIGVNVASPTSTVSLNFNSGTTPAAQTIGVERTTTASANGTPLTITSGAAVSGGTNLAGGDLTLSAGTSTGTGSSNIAFNVATAGSSGTTDRTPATKMYLSGAGALGLGTTSPTKDVSLDGNSNRTMWLERNSSSTGKDLTIQAGGAKSSSNLNGGNLYLSAGISTGNAAGAGTIIFQTPTPGSSGSSDNAPSSKMVIDPNGKVGIGTTSPGYTLDVSGDLNVTGTCWNTSGSWTVSDRQFKKNITDLTDPLAQVLRLRGVQYDFKVGEVPGYQFTTRHQIGYIAQELEQVIPEAVAIKKDGYRAVDYQMVIPYLSEAIKAQQSEIAAKDAQIADLSARLSKLEAAVFALSANATANKSNSTTSAGDQVVFYQNNPNPFSNATTISYHLPQSISNAELLVLAANGAEVMRVPLAVAENGTVTVSADKLAAGQYFYTIIADGIQSQSKKMTVVK
ncbi:MAG: tail fiber domain-containing protein [Bacteroidetes bacterium]|nr:tail fiber domain-containing protein [Bacteroidota bacterium]